MRWRRYFQSHQRSIGRGLCRKGGAAPFEGGANQHSFSGTQFIASICLLGMETNKK
jgi:hypothetical protein